MREDPIAVLTAFLDGEITDADEVAAALTTPEGQAALIEVALLKIAMRQDQPLPRPDFVRALEARLASGTPWIRRAPAWPRVAMAAAVLVAILGGFWLGESRASRREDQPPASSRVVHFQRGVNWQEAR
jgi:negative regulator of sigma E activity